MTDLVFSPAPGTCYNSIAFMHKRCDECTFLKEYRDTMKCPYVGWDDKKIAEYFKESRMKKD